jgi:7-cyano-7-deazaguanine synthase
MNRAIVMLSGGIDSAVALAWASKNFEELISVSFHYYLRPFRERLAVYRLLQHFPSRLIEIPVTFLRETTDSKHAVSRNVPTGYIANRNMIFYSTASHFAEIHECRAIIGGHNAEDRMAFPDASADFFLQLQSLINSALFQAKIKIELPFVHMGKQQVVEKGLEWKVPLQNTWSCYWNLPVPCGSCSSCTERARAFEKLGIPDPLVGE